LVKDKKIVVLQVDNRPYVEYIRLGASINRTLCQKLGYNYNFLFMEEVMIDRFNSHPHTDELRFRAAQSAKMGIMEEYLNTTNNDIVVFLDSDAWIENPTYLNQLITELINNENKQGCFSREPYRPQDCYVNSGSFIIKINNYTRNMYKAIVHNYFHEGKRLFPKISDSFDMYYTSEWVYENKEDFYIFIPQILNTPRGIVLRHDWRQERGSMELNLKGRFKEIIAHEINQADSFDYSKHLDLCEYPNIQTKHWGDYEIYYTQDR
jgi:hypothetical protein|tara:strand:- start:4682 stop:5476 length:795 start_codon:yes stop_codon:yes gene_type:complete